MSQPGFWENLFLGSDLNQNGQLDPGERGILTAWIDVVGQIGSFGVNTVLDGIGLFIPTNLAVQPQEIIREAYYMANLWVPLDLLFLWLTLYWATFFVVTTSRWIVKIFPFIG